MHQRDWEERPPIFPSAYRVSTHETTGITPANLVFARELRLQCDLLFGVPPPPDKEQSTTHYAANLVQQLLDVHPYTFNRYRGLVTELTPGTSDWPIGRDSRKLMKSDSTDRPGPE